MGAAQLVLTRKVSRAPKAADWNPAKVRAWEVRGEKKYKKALAWSGQKVKEIPLISERITLCCFAVLLFSQLLFNK